MLIPRSLSDTRITHWTDADAHQIDVLCFFCARPDGVRVSGRMRFFIFSLVLDAYDEDGVACSELIGVRDGNVADCRCEDSGPTMVLVCSSPTGLSPVLATGSLLVMGSDTTDRAILRITLAWSNASTSSITSDGLAFI